jgi:hypothetical protein
MIRIERTQFRAAFYFSARWTREAVWLNMIDPASGAPKGANLDAGRRTSHDLTIKRRARTPIEFVCEYCGKPGSAFNKNRKYHDDCKNAANYSKRPEVVARRAILAENAGHCSFRYSNDNVCNAQAVHVRSVAEFQGLARVNSGSAGFCSYHSTALATGRRRTKLKRTGDRNVIGVPIMNASTNIKTTTTTSLAYRFRKRHGGKPNFQLDPI